MLGINFLPSALSPIRDARFESAAAGAAPETAAADASDMSKGFGRSNSREFSGKSAISDAANVARGDVDLGDRGDEDRGEVERGDADCLGEALPRGDVDDAKFPPADVLEALEAVV